MQKKEIETYCPKSRQEWRTWLEKNSATEHAVWLVYFKSFTKVPSLSWSDAVDEALCFGWIDSTKKTIDKERYMQYFSKRKAKSNWSKINKEKVDQLIQNNLMTQAGFDSIETAKQNGSWTLIDAIEALVVPKDLEEALATDQTAKDYFEGLSKSDTKLLLHWVFSAKRTETRQKRIVDVVACAREKLKPKQLR